MNIAAHISKLIKGVYSGGNWCDVNIKDTLAGISWQEATTKVYSFNTIAVLVYHMNYYVVAILKVLQEEPLDAHDKYSFDCPPIRSQQDWENLLDQFWSDGEKFISRVEQLPDNKLDDTFVHEKYGNYYRNLHGVIEHFHYHLGQIVLIKKIILQAK
jgi:hypothetical protein